MIADFFRFLRAALFHGFIGDGKACVHSHHCGNEIISLGEGMTGKINIFLNCGIRLLFSVTVGNFITKNGTYAEFSCGLFYGEKRAFDFSEGSMMVKNGGYSVLDTLQIGSFCGNLGEFIIQIPVDGPPKSVQNL